MISESDFESNYVPMKLSKDGDMMSPDYRGALNFAKDKGLSEQHIWAITEGDDDNSLYANPGPALVNVIGDVVTENPWENEDLVATYFEDEDQDLDHSFSPGMG